MYRIAWMVLLFCGLGIGACSSSSTDGKDDGGNDAAVDDSATTDALPEEDSSLPDAQSDALPDVLSDGFTGDASLEDWVIREPESVQCKLVEKDPGFPDPGDYMNYRQTDLVCTFDYNGLNGLIYVQDTPLECKHTAVVGRWVTKSKTDLSLIKIGDQVDYLENAFYEYGGQHMRDRLTFDYRGVRFVYYHVCGDGNNMAYSTKNPNCAMIKDTDGKMLDNGCTPERTRPIVCKEVDENGQYDETMTDNYKYLCGTE